MGAPSHMLAGRSLRSWAAVAFALSAAALAVAYVSEFVFDLHPCDMCLWQRLPYAVVMALSLLACFVPMQRTRVWLLWACTAALAAGAVLAAYHTGVEWRWWEGPTACGGALDGTLTAEQILDRIRGAAVVSCNEAALRVLGLSMAGWNALYSAGCTALLAVGLKSRSKE